MQILELLACTMWEYYAKTLRGRLIFTRTFLVIPVFCTNYILLFFFVYCTLANPKFNLISGLKINEARPHDKLPYRGAWLWVGSEMIHLMELPNPDPYTGRPEHGGRDRHTCIAIRDVSKLKAILDKAGNYSYCHSLPECRKICGPCKFSKHVKLLNEKLFFCSFYISGIPYTLSRSGRPAIFTRDPDTNALEFTQVDCWNVLLFLAWTQYNPEFYFVNVIEQLKSKGSWFCKSVLPDVMVCHVMRSRC